MHVDGQLKNAQLEETASDDAGVRSQVQSKIIAGRAYPRFWNGNEWVNFVTGETELVTMTTSGAVADDVDFVLANSAGAPFTITLPSAALWPGRLISFTKVSSDFNAVTITPYGSDTIQSGSDWIIGTQWETLSLLSDGVSNWSVTSQRTDSTWVPVSFTGNWVTNTTYTAKMQRVGSTANFQVKLATSGAPDSVSLELYLPAGLAIDSAQLVNGTGASVVPFSQGQVLDAGTAAYGVIQALYLSSTSLAVRYGDDSGGGIALSDITQSNPMTWAAGDYLILNFSVPIVGWR